MQLLPPRRVVLAILALILWPWSVSIADDPDLSIVLEGQRNLSTTIQGGQGADPGGARSARAEANTRAAYEQVQSYLSDGIMDMARVSEINATLRSGIASNGETAGGGLRQSRGAVGDFLMPTSDGVGSTRVAYPNPKTLPAEAAKLDAFLKGIAGRPLTRVQAINAAADVHSFIVQNHLFADGNGRTARLVADWILMNNGLPPADYTAQPVTDYVPDRRLPPEQNRTAFRRYLERAVAASEARSAMLPPRTRSVRGSRGPAAEPVAAGPVRAPGKPGEIELLGQRSGAVYTRPLVGVTTMAGGYWAGAVAHQWASTGQVDLWQPIGELGTVEGAAGFVGGVSGFVAAEYLAGVALSNMIPIPVVGRVLGRPLAQAMVRSTVGAAGGYAVGSAARGGPIDWKDLAGSSVASGVGMALGSLVFPPVGTIVGGIAGQVAWDLVSGWRRRKDGP